MRFLLFAFLLASTLIGAEQECAESYAEAQQQAIEEHKGILAVITKQTCRWCRKLEDTTLENDAVVDRIHSKFVPVLLTRNQDEYPGNLMAKMVPVSYFLSSDGRPIMRGIMGYWSAEDYLLIMDDVDRSIRKHERREKQTMKEAIK